MCVVSRLLQCYIHTQKHTHTLRPCENFTYFLIVCLSEVSLLWSNFLLIWFCEHRARKLYDNFYLFHLFFFLLFLLCVQRDIKDDHIILKKEKENLVRPLEFYFYNINLYCYRVRRCWEINLLDFNSLYVCEIKMSQTMLYNNSFM